MCRVFLTGQQEKELKMGIRFNPESDDPTQMGTEYSPDTNYPGNGGNSKSDYHQTESGAYRTVNNSSNQAPAAPDNAQNSPYGQGSPYGQNYAQNSPYGQGSAQGSSFGQNYAQNNPYGQNAPYGRGSAQESSYGQNYAQNNPNGQNYAQNDPYGRGSAQESSYAQNYAQNNPYGQNAPHGQNYAQNDPYGRGSAQGSSFGQNYAQNNPYGQNYAQNDPYGRGSAQGSSFGQNYAQDGPGTSTESTSSMWNPYGQNDPYGPDKTVKNPHQQANAQNHPGGQPGNAAPGSPGKPKKPWKIIIPIIACVSILAVVGIFFIAKNLFSKPVTSGGGESKAPEAAESKAPEAVESKAPDNGESKVPGNGGSYVPVAEEGKVLNIEAWNEEFMTRVKDHYPGYEKISDTEGRIGDVTVKWIITSAMDSAYQNKLDADLAAQADAAADEKIDIFLVETEYVSKYIDAETNAAMPLKDLGITDADLSKQFAYTQDIVRDANGDLRGSSWQACSGGMIYRRDIAQEVFGVSEPEDVQKLFKDWDSYKGAAAKLKAKGYKITSTVYDTYRVYSNNVSGPWVQDGKVFVDDNIRKWVDDSMELVKAEETDTFDLWSDNWAKGFFQDPDGKVFAYFGPMWLIDYSTHSDEYGSVGKAGGWALMTGPQSFYWGGTWICAAQGTDNPALVKDIILTMTANDEVMMAITVDDNDCANNKVVLKKLAEDPDFGNAILGGQNPYGMLAAGAELIDMSNISFYDQRCNEEFQMAMKSYFEGYASYEEALAEFKKNIKYWYPELE